MAEDYSDMGDYSSDDLSADVSNVADDVTDVSDLVDDYSEDVQDFDESGDAGDTYEDYSDEELLSIFKTYVDEQDYTLEEGIDENVLSAIAAIREKAGENFGNAREIRNFFEKVISRQANRIMEISADELYKDEGLLTTITADDLNVM